MGLLIIMKIIIKEKINITIILIIMMKIQGIKKISWINHLQISLVMKMKICLMTIITMVVIIIIDQKFLKELQKIEENLPVIIVIIIIFIMIIIKEILMKLLRMKILRIFYQMSF